jgi:rhamnosyltransferase
MNGQQVKSSEPAVQTAVVMCTHNGARFVAQQLASIAAQTSQVDEMYLFDWNSRDETAQIVQDWIASQQPASRTMRLQKMDTAPGPARSFLHALELVAHESDAELIFLSDQDDIWTPQKVQAFTDSYGGAEGAFDLAFSDVMVLEDADGRVRPTFYGEGSPYVRPSSVRDSSLLVTNPAIGMTMCVRREWLVRVSAAFRLHWIMHDWALMALCWITGARARYIDVPLVSYRQHDSNTLGASTSRSILSRAGHIRAHVSEVRRQIDSMVAARELLGGTAEMAGVLDRAKHKWHQVRVAAQSRMLTPRYRVLLAGALAIF